MMRPRLPLGLLRDLRAARTLNRCRALAYAAGWQPFGFMLWLTAPNAELSQHTPIELIMADCGPLVLAEVRRATR